ncbi:poly-gamma-glutamate synthesis protein (capsule biosynthesis protein) [Arthrobacter sp. ok909]|uniref:CapA family protein n=1 Tax=Arthrobacter sp. ok909 TaxID=1761746 RepID=UPI0008880FB8|nr:CapA family protein [Arthrobacter sp. ok909]SDP41010.1 poly-gamma-glutamate synthesis protein (capsule biosynthesis protein) [Arthrobacter sp. ok909]
MGNLSAGLRGRIVAAASAVASAVVLAVLLASCGLLAGPGEPSPSPATGSTGEAAEGPGPPSGTPTPTPGKGPGCAAVRCTSVLVTGDMLVHPQLWQQAREDARAAGAAGLDFGPLLEGQRRYIEQSDVAICHLETPVAGPDGPFSGYPSFNVPPQIITAVRGVGYQACTTASNHTVDRGTAGLVRTLDALDAAGLRHSGSYRTEAESQGVLILQTPAARIAVVDATYGLNGLRAEQSWQVDLLDPAAMISKARKARALGADIVLGVMHAGDEYSSEPNAQQREVAHTLVDSGQFSMIYGHHSHSVLPIEKYKGTWIVYGLGNGITELSPSFAVNNEGLLVRVQFSQDAAGAWAASDLAWAPSVVVRGPYRWCSVAADAPQGRCAGTAADAATRRRTTAAVESMGAAAAGAHELILSRKP